jgi:N-acetylmuramoyl-L-alanine amidase
MKAAQNRGPRLVLDLIPSKARVKMAQSVKKPSPAERRSSAQPTASPKQERPAEAINITQAGGPIVIEQPSANPSIITSGKKRRDKIIVVIDPGHGGVDPGAIGKNKTYEKDVVLSISKQVRDIINDTPGYMAYMTRDRDVFIPLAQRVRTAQRKQADLFVSIHADAHANREIRGGSVYVLSETSSDKEAERLARLANEGDMVAGIDLSEEDDQVRDILIDLVQRETMNKSAVFAREMLNEMNRVVKMRSTEPRFAGFRVLKAPEVPAILIEASYMSNPEDEKMLNNAKAQKRLADSIARGIFNYSRKYLNAE